MFDYFLAIFNFYCHISHLKPPFVVVHVPIVEIDVPRVVRVISVSSARPVVVGLSPAFLFIHLFLKPDSYD
jgi:hypothetical protein